MNSNYNTETNQPAKPFDFVLIFLLTLLVIVIFFLVYVLVKPKKSSKNRPAEERPGEKIPTVPLVNKPPEENDEVPTATINALNEASKDTTCCGEAEEWEDSAESCVKFKLIADLWNERTKLYECNRCPFTTGTRIAMIQHRRMGLEKLIFSFPVLRELLFEITRTMKYYI